MPFTSYKHFWCQSVGQVEQVRWYHHCRFKLKFNNRVNTIAKCVEFQLQQRFSINLFNDFELKSISLTFSWQFVEFVDLGPLRRWSWYPVGTWLNRVCTHSGWGSFLPHPVASVWPCWLVVVLHGKKSTLTSSKKYTGKTSRRDTLFSFMSKRDRFSPDPWRVIRPGTFWRGIFGRCGVSVLVVVCYYLSRQCVMTANHRYQSTEEHLAQLTLCRSAKDRPGNCRTSGHQLAKIESLFGVTR